MNSLEFSRLLTNLKIVSEIQISSQQSPLTCFSFAPLFGVSLSQCYVEIFSVGLGNLKLTKACRVE